MGNIRYILGLSSPMNKICRPTYLRNDKEYFIVKSADIEGGHGSHLESNSLLDQLQHSIKAVMF